MCGREVVGEGTDSLVGEGVVVILPRELSLDIAPGSQTLTRLDDL